MATTSHVQLASPSFIFLFSLLFVITLSAPLPRSRSLHVYVRTNSSSLQSPISTASPPSYFQNLPQHPCVNIQQGKDYTREEAICHVIGSTATRKPVHTNKWYQNMVVGDRKAGMFPLPYYVQWQTMERGGVEGWGAANHDLDQAKFTSINFETYNPSSGVPAHSYFLPLDTFTATLSATELSAQNPSSLPSLPNEPTNQFCINATISPASDPSSSILFPTCQGMAFLTGIYNNLTPKVVVYGAPTAAANNESMWRIGEGGEWVKVRVGMQDGSSTLVYIMATTGTKWTEETIKSSITVAPDGEGRTLVQMTGKMNAVVQIAKISKISKTPTADEATYDAAVGWYPVSASITSMSVTNTTGEYSITYVPAGAAGQPPTTGQPLIFALPHLVEKFEPETAKTKTGLTLNSRVNGMMTAIASSKICMVEEELPVETGFGLDEEITDVERKEIGDMVQSEIEGDFELESEGTYTTGKLIQKYSELCHTALAGAQNKTLAKQCYQKLKKSFDPFTKNKQIIKLLYDQTFGGIVSEGFWKKGNGTDRTADFGNTFYNDHHFHYGYIIYGGAIMVKLENELYGTDTWLKENGEYIKTLIRTTANPSPDDPNFPEFRYFDWFHGHSWAGGLFQFADGRNEESSSEDVNHLQATKLWGMVTGDKATENRGNLMLGVLKGSINKYFYTGTPETIHPKDLAKNMVNGILWENKAERGLWFNGPGILPHAIQGIQMIPTTPISSYIRSQKFCKTERDIFWNNGIPFIPEWTSTIVIANAGNDPDGAWEFFANSDFNEKELDSGMTRASGMWHSAQMGTRRDREARGYCPVNYRRSVNGTSCEETPLAIITTITSTYTHTIQSSSPSVQFFTSIPFLPQHETSALPTTTSNSAPEELVTSSKSFTPISPTSAPTSPEIKVIVEIDSSTMAFIGRFQPTDTILSVKTRLETQLGVPKSQFHLFRAETLLGEDSNVKTLAELGISDGTILQVAPAELQETTSPAVSVTATVTREVTVTASYPGTAPLLPPIPTTATFAPPEQTSSPSPTETGPEMTTTATVATTFATLQPIEPTGGETTTTPLPVVLPIVTPITQSEPARETGLKTSVRFPITLGPGVKSMAFRG